MIKRFLAALLLIASTVAFVACSREKSFRHCEIVITLPSDFEDKGESQNFDMLLSNGVASVGIARITFVAGINMGIPETYSAKEFARYFMYSTEVDAEVYFYGDMPYYSYYDESTGDKMFCLATFYRTLYAYVYVVYAVEESFESEWREKFLDIGKNVVFDYSE